MTHLSISWHETLPSTQDEALRRLALGEENFAVAARTQTAGRGRRGGVWVAPPDAALLFSFGLRILAVRPASDLTLVLALSLLETLEPLLPLEARNGLRVKWPNDLWLGDAKLAGILGEARTAGDTTHVALGAGVNLAQKREDFPPGLDPSPTSLVLAGCGAVPVPEALLERLLTPFSRRLEEWTDGGLSPILAVLERRWLFQPGETLQIEWNEQAHAVRYRGVDGAGALQVELADGGRLITLLSGEARRIRPTG